jgi:hypothetical protein
MPAVEVIGEFAFGTFDSPGFHPPIVAFDDADEIHDLAAPYRIMQYVTARPEPVRAHHPCELRRKPIHRHETAPRNASCELGTTGAEKTGTHLGVNTVGADDEVRRNHLAVRKRPLGVIRRLADCDAFPAE